MLNETELRRLPKLEPIEARFWSKVSIVDDDDSCWEWQATRGKIPDDYGFFAWKDGPFTVKAPGAHRVAFFLTNGFVPEHTCHTCDNPPCVRPSHLFAGTHQENIADRHAKGRSRGAVQVGEANHNAALVEADVLFIRDTLAIGGDVSETDLAALYGVDRATITLIRQGATWSHVGGPTSATGSRRVKLTDAEVAEIRESTERGVLLAARYGVSAALISKIRRGHHR